MKTGLEAEYKTSWAKVSVPAQRFIGEKGGFESDIPIPLQLNLYGSNGYIESVVSVLKAQELPVFKSTYRRRIYETTPVLGLIAMSDFSRLREGTDGIFFARSPQAKFNQYIEALEALVASSNRTLRLQQLDLIPPPTLFRKPHEAIETADSA